jgi:monovalent cation/hydrogen antiporter
LCRAKTERKQLHTLEIVVALVVLSTVVATTAERLRAPAPSLLVVAGLAVGFLPGVPAVEVGPSTISLVVLPPLIYAGATDLPLSDLRKVAGRVTALAVGLVAVTAAATATVVHALAPDVPLRVGFVLGAVLASTDPVAVGALARRLQLPPRLLAVLLGESLLNDATSLVLFRVSLGAVAAGGLSAGATLGQFARLAGGGIAFGLGCVVAARWLAARTDDPVLSTVIALVIPYAAYLGAESLHLSGVTAVVITGLGMGRANPRIGSGPSRVAVQTVYAVVVFLLESVVFAVIGLQVPTLLRRLPAHEPAVWPLILAITAVLLGVRLLWVAPQAFLSAATTTKGPPDDAGSTWRRVAVVTWAGTRGVVPLAAILSVPLTVGGQPFPHRDLLLVIATGVIVLTLVVQGLTLEPLVQRLGVRDDQQRLAAEEAIARHRTALAARARLDELLDLEAAPVAVAQRLRQAIDQRIERTRVRLTKPPPGEQDTSSTGVAYRRLRQDLLAAEAEELIRLQQEGVIGEAIRRKLQAGLDAESTGLS